MRILHTGSTGFLGSRLVDALEADGHDVFKLQRYDAHRIESPRVIWGDMKDADLTLVVERVQPDLVIHQAALASNEAANRLPTETLQTNAVGTSRLIDALVHYKISTPLILASSSEVYGALKGPANEESERVPVNKYAVSKMAAEDILRMSPLPYVIMRPFNTYGRGLIGMPKFVVDEAIYQALTTKRITLRDPLPRRDFLFREDHISAYMAVVRSLQNSLTIAGSTFTFGTGRAITIGEMAQTVAKATGIKDLSFDKDNVREGDIGYLCADYTGVKETIGWEPGFDLEKGISQAVLEWKGFLAKGGKI